MNTKDDIKIPTARHSVPFRSAGQRASTLPSDAADAPDSERQRPETPFQDSPEMVESLLPTPPNHWGPPLQLEPEQNEVTNRLLAGILNEMVAQSEALRKTQLYTQKTERNEMKQTATSWTFQIITSGSIIAVFLAALDLAILSYPNDLRNNAQPRFADNFITSCLTISLLLSLTVVFVSSICSFFHLWQTLLDVGDKMSFEIWSPFGTLVQKSSTATAPRALSVPETTEYWDKHKVYSRSDIKVMFTVLSALFNVLVTPALLSTILATITFAWTRQSRLVGISAVSLAGIIAALLTLALAVVVSMTLEQRRRIKDIEREGNVDGEKGADYDRMFPGLANPVSRPVRRARGTSVFRKRSSQTVRTEPLAIVNSQFRAGRTGSEAVLPTRPNSVAGYHNGTVHFA